MNELNFDSYFESTNNEYYDPVLITTILEGILGNKIESIRAAVSASEVIVTREQITEFLERKFEEEDPDLKKRIESPKPQRNRKVSKRTEEEIAASAREFSDELSSNRYRFEPYTLEYFKRYSGILREKALLLLSIIGGIGTRDTVSIQAFLKELDIQLDEDGSILRSDIERLITPTVYNISELQATVARANNLSTYLTFKLSPQSLFKAGLGEGALYPSSSLQINNLGYDNERGYVPLSSRQRAELEEEQKKAMTIIAKRLNILE